jgi:hypothetical protein
MSEDDTLRPEDFWRQMDILNPGDFEEVGVTVIGAGGIGSPTTLALAKMGIKKITVYDGDTIERHNLPNQFYRLEDVGRLKVDALADICRSFSGTKIVAIPEYYADQPLAGIVVSGVDSMAARKLIWEKVRYNIGIPVYVEARMAAQVACINTVNPCDPDLVKWYESTLYSDKEAMAAPCTERAIMYNVFMIAGLIGGQIKKIIKEEEVPKEMIFSFEPLMFMQKPMYRQA